MTSPFYPWQTSTSKLTCPQSHSARMVVLRVQLRVSDPIKCECNHYTLLPASSVWHAIPVTSTFLGAHSTMRQRSTGTFPEIPWNVAMSTLTRSPLWYCVISFWKSCIPKAAVHQASFPKPKGLPSLSPSIHGRHSLCDCYCFPLRYWLFLTCQRELSAKWKAGISQSIVIRAAFIIHEVTFRARAITLNNQKKKNGELILVT